jgi:hypothetical protein
MYAIKTIVFDFQHLDFSLVNREPNKMAHSCSHVALSIDSITSVNKIMPDF